MGKDYHPELTVQMSRIIASLMLVVSSCAITRGAPISEIAGEINGTLARGEYVLCPGDSFEVHFENRLDWDQEVLVQPDGRAGFLALEPMTVAGLTPEGLQRELTTAYAGILENPGLAVSLTAMAPRMITILGEVRSPGRYPLEPGQRVSLVDAFGLAKGYFRDRARLKSVVLVRWDAVEERQLAWTIDAREEHWDDLHTIFLQQYDLIYVPNTPVDSVNIWVDKYLRRMIPVPQLLQ